MSLTEISLFFEQSMPMGIVAVIVYQAIMSRDMKNIKENLTNHVTDTDKKIDKLDSKIDKVKAELKEYMKKIETDLRESMKKMEINLKEHIAELKAGQNRMESKFDKLMNHLLKK